MGKLRKSTRFETGQVIMASIYDGWLKWVKDNPKHGTDYEGKTESRHGSIVPTPNLVGDIKKALHDVVYAHAELDASEVEKRILFNGFCVLLNAAFRSYDEESAIQAEFDGLLSEGKLADDKQDDFVEFSARLGIPLEVMARKFADAAKRAEAEAEAEAEAK